MCRWLVVIEYWTQVMAGLTKADRQRINRKLESSTIWQPNKRRKAMARVAEMAAKLVVEDGDIEAAKHLSDAVKYLDGTDPSSDGDQVRKGFGVEEGRVHKSDLTDAERENMDEVQDWIEGQSDGST